MTTVKAPVELMEEIPAHENALQTTVETRADIHNVLHGKDDRLVVVCGPCSIHDVDAAKEYARRLLSEKQKYSDELLIVMRVYFEKPRTTVGWKGLINDPHLDGSFKINEGLSTARQLLLDLNNLGMPCGTEYLDPISPQYYADLIAWGAIGARTTESQGHRELASGLSCPVGFKNGTNGNVQIAVDAIGAASQSHNFLSVTKEGRSAIFRTTGNEDCHVILRGGAETNYDAQSIADACELLVSAQQQRAVMVDMSHANSRKNPDNQALVADDLAEQIAAGNQTIFGVMIESHLVKGNQSINSDTPLVYGQSITDGCIDWEQTTGVLDVLATAVKQRRSANAVLLTKANE
jgi:3-deoxy-7-phosphoheptulonate synthase